MAAPDGAPLAVGTRVDVTDHDRGPFFVLVSVTWATPVTTHNLDTGEAVTEYVPGLLGPSEYDVAGAATGVAPARRAAMG